MEWLSWVISALVVVNLIGWLLYALALHRLPSTGRPKVERFDRYGDRLPPREAPDYHLFTGSDRE